ncbi:MAG TPA: hypothetical protein VL177_17165 [Terriglobales bacterium]|jgi:hypothetical protein|nr:hypothetical protein [Terriglobales bacterium]
MSATLPVMSRAPEAPKFLIEWEPRWKAFATALSPAMQRSPRHLQGECRAGMFPASGMVVAWVLEIALLLVVITLPNTLQFMQTFTPPVHPKYEVIYFSGDYLPQTTDTGGAQAGHTGKSGGRTAMNKQQVIKVARGDSLTQQVVDVPKLKLPPSRDAVANLIAIAAAKPGPPPTEGLQMAKPKLTLPEDAIPPEVKVARDKLSKLPDISAQAVAPPVDDISRDQLRAGPNMAAQVVPPSVQIERNKLLRTPALGVTVVRPAPTVAGNIERVRAPQLQAEVVPPPVSARDVQYDNPNPKLALPPPTPVQPAPATNSLAKEIWSAAGSLFGGGTKNVVPPPVQPTAGFSDGKPLGAGLARGLTGGPGVVPPPPNLAGDGLAGSGKSGGSTGETGQLAALRPAPVMGPSGGNPNGSGVVMSMQPGEKVGMPGDAAGGALAMSRTGGGRPGVGGEGNGAGIGKGTGAGSGKVGEGSGAADTGTGFGAKLNAKGGISPAPGRGGAGSGGGHTAMAGVAIRGGVVNLPSFAVGGDPPSIPGRTPSERKLTRPDITVIATPSSGGALNLYGALKGDKVYTIYIDTHQGVAVLQFADPGSQNTGFDEDLTAPEAIRTELPPGLKKTRLVITCTMDRAGLLRNVKILQGPSSEKVSLVTAALSKWRFRPVLRGNDPISVDAILGFNVDTR